MEMGRNIEPEELFSSNITKLNVIETMTYIFLDVQVEGNIWMDLSSDAYYFWGYKK